MSVAPFTTWPLVTISPSDETITPVPTDWPPSMSALMVTTDGAMWSITLAHVETTLDRPARVGHVDRFVAGALGRRVEPVGDLTAEQRTGETRDPGNRGNHADEQTRLAVWRGVAMVPAARRSHPAPAVAAMSWISVYPRTRTATPVGVAVLNYFTTAR